MKKKILHYQLEFHPGFNKGKIVIIVDGESDAKTLPIDSYTEFIACAMILQTGESYLTNNEILACSA